MQDDQNADFKITRDAAWYHNGAPIKRAALAKLFSDRALVVDEDGLYWLQTPFEKYPVEVEDVPYVIVDYERAGDDYDFITNMEDRIEIGPDHPLELRNNIPYVEVRKGLYARMGRAAYYNLIEQCGPALLSRGEKFLLGSDENE